MIEQSDVIYSLERDLPTNELIGRKFFIDLTKWFMVVKLADNTLHEKQYWGAYTIITPKLLDITNLSDDSISISSFSAEDKHYAVLSFKNQDPTNTDLPLKARILLQNILTQLKG
jgi:hypothetical protein